MTHSIFATNVNLDDHVKIDGIVNLDDNGKNGAQTTRAMERSGNGWRASV
jgi:hypothetical protein